MRELLYNAARHYKRGRGLLERGDVRAALAAFEEALRDLHAVKPQRMRDVLLAQVYLSRYQAASEVDARGARADLQLGYSYARTTREPSVRQLAETLWRGERTRSPGDAKAGGHGGRSGRGGRGRRGARSS